MGDPFRTPDWETELVRDFAMCGFSVETVERKTKCIEFGTVTDVWRHMWSAGFRACLDLMSDPQLTQFRTAAEAEFAKITVDGKIPWHFEAISVAARPEYG